MTQAARNGLSFFLGLLSTTAVACTIVGPLAIVGGNVPGGMLCCSAAILAWQATADCYRRLTR